MQLSTVRKRPLKRCSENIWNSFFWDSRVSVLTLETQDAETRVSRNWDSSVKKQKIECLKINHLVLRKNDSEKRLFKRYKINLSTSKNISLWRFLEKKFIKVTEKWVPVVKSVSNYDAKRLAKDIEKESTVSQTDVMAY